MKHLHRPARLRGAGGHSATGRATARGGSHPLSQPPRSARAEQVDQRSDPWRPAKGWRAASWNRENLGFGGTTSAGIGRAKASPPPPVWPPSAQRCVLTRPSCARRRCRRPAAGCSPVGPDCWRTARRPSLIRTAAPGHRMLARPPLGAGAPRPAARSSTGAGAVRPSRLPFASSAGSCSSTQGWRGARRSGLSCRFDSGVGVPAIGTGIPVTFRPEGGASGQESRHGTGRRVEVRDEPPTSEPWPAWVDERWRTNGADAATKERAAPAPSDAGGASRGAPAITSTHPRTAAVRQREEHRKSGTGSVGGGVARFEAAADAGLGVAVAGTAWAALEPAGKLGHVDADGRSKVPPPAGPRAAAGSGSGLVCSRLGNRADARRRAGPPATRSGARNVGCAPAHPRFRSRRPRAPGQWWRFRGRPSTATSTSPNLRPDPRAQLDRARFT